MSQKTYEARFLPSLRDTGMNCRRNTAAASLLTPQPILLLEEFGNNLREPHSKAMGDGLFELRIKFSNDISRIFYFFCVGNKIILTNGFIKKTNKTPVSELNLAKKYKLDYEQRSVQK